MRRLAALALVVVAACTAACGKRGDPRPPVPVIPKAASDLVVAQRGTKLILAWSYPSLTTAGESLHDIRRVIVYRYAEDLPVEPGGRDPNSILPGDVDPTVPRAIALFAKVPAIAPVQFGKLKERIDSIEGANLPAATAGARLVFEDTPPFRTTDGRPRRYTYAVVTQSATARSDLSNLATIIPLDVPMPPTELAAAPAAEGVKLSWKAPEKSVAGADKPFLAGYNVYRLGAGEEFTELSTPINTSPASGTSYTDVPPFGTYSYRVTAVASTAPPRIESEPSPAVRATFKDLTPPPKPPNLTALLETKSVRLIWDPVEAPDLAGYNVYRYEGTARLKLSISVVKETFFVDISVDPGIEYTYALTSVDKSGNESAETLSEKVLVPKTP